MAHPPTPPQSQPAGRKRVRHLALALACLIGLIAWLRGCMGNDARTKPTEIPVVSLPKVTLPGKPPEPPPGPLGPTSPAPDQGPTLQAFTFTMAGEKLVLSNHLTTAGRVKAPPFSNAPDRFEFVVKDAAGRIVYSGAVDHPTRHWYEVEDEQKAGQLKHTFVEAADGAFLVRIPGDLSAASLTLTEVLSTAGVSPRKPQPPLTLSLTP